MPLHSSLKFRINRFLSALVDILLFQLAGVLVAMVTYLIIPTSMVPWYLLPYFLFLNKDFLCGRGIGKRILKHGVLDFHSRQPASTWQCFIRNLLLPFIIVEPLAMLVNPRRRLGDFIAGTVVEEVVSNRSVKDEMQEFREWTQLLYTLLASIVYIGLLIILVQFGTMIMVGS